MTSPGIPQDTKDATSPDPRRREPGDVREMFAAIAPAYDALNHIFSGGIDIVWRNRSAKMLSRHLATTHAGSPVLDLATGSGDLAKALIQNKLQVIGADFCLPLLKQARAKTATACVQADALQLPFADGVFSAVTIAFGFRNFQNRAKALSECLRILRPSGGLWILEFSQPDPWIAPLHALYTRHFMPAVVRLISGRQAAYRYLADTIEEFPSARNLATDLQNAGFENVSWQRWTFGTVALHYGFKPAANASPAVPSTRSTPDDH